MSGVCERQLIGAACQSVTVRTLKQASWLPQTLRTSRSKSAHPLFNFPGHPVITPSMFKNPRLSKWTPKHGWNEEMKNSKAAFLPHGHLGEMIEKCAKVPKRQVARWDTREAENDKGIQRREHLPPLAMPGTRL